MKTRIIFMEIVKRVNWDLEYLLSALADNQILRE